MKKIISILLFMMMLNGVIAVELEPTGIVIPYEKQSFFSKFFNAFAFVLAQGNEPDGWSCSYSNNVGNKIFKSTFGLDSVVKVGNACPDNAMVVLYKCSNSACSSLTKEGVGYKIDGVKPKFKSFVINQYYKYKCYACSINGQEATGSSSGTCVENKYYCWGNGFVGQCKGGSIMRYTGSGTCSAYNMLNECAIDYVKTKQYGNSVLEVCKEESSVPSIPSSTTPVPTPADTTVKNDKVGCVEGKYYCWGSGFVGKCDGGAVIRRADMPNLCSDFGDEYVNDCKIDSPDYGSSASQVCARGIVSSTCSYKEKDYKVGDIIKECSTIEKDKISVLTMKKVITETNCDFQQTGTINCGLGKVCIDNACQNEVIVGITDKIEDVGDVIGGFLGDECDFSKDCDDGDICTVDRCNTKFVQGNRCEYEPVLNCEAKLACEGNGDKWIEDIDKDGGFWCITTGLGCTTYDNSYCQSKWVSILTIFLLFLIIIGIGFVGYKVAKKRRWL